jgi:two-component system, chemotaxis family, CheB/CheR fusion protein
MGETDQDEQQQRPAIDATRAPSMVVGLGASAGGIKALGEFFAHVPPQAPFAYVVILHLSPDHDSRLAEVLQTATPLPVRQVTDQVVLSAGHVYVIPPNQTLAVHDQTLALRPFARPEERRAPVDMFFRTLGDAYGGRAAAIVLSGTGPNGSSGLKRVKEHGGLTIAQDPAEAEYADMPSNSIATGLVDLVLPVAEIPKRVVEYYERVHSGVGIATDREGSAVAGAVEARPDLHSDGAAEEWRDILTLLRVRTGHDFSNYKPATLRRRVERRVHVRGLTSLGEYVRLLREHPDEATALMKELLISVTNFFRDREAWEMLERRILPALFDRKRAVDQIRVWSAGCATGEEAYSLAMILSEFALGVADSPSIQVFASDLDADAIAHAREGVYTDADLADVAPDRLQRFFVRDPAGYRVRRELREMVLFANHNVIKDPPFSHLDLIACRNLLIYLNRTVQERLLETFHFALRPGGYIFLGQSETADGTGELFVAVDKGAHLFEARSVMTRPSLPLADRHISPLAMLPRVPEPRPQAERISPGDLHLRLLEQYAPPSLVVTEEHMLVHASPGATRFLSVPPGEPSRDVLKLVIPGLRPDVRTALYLAAQQRAPIEVGGVRVPVTAGGGAIRLMVRPVLREDDPPRGYFLVMFDDERADDQGGHPVQMLHPTEPEARRLDEELSRVKEQLRTTIEQYESHNEEARAANEELQAMNEELRSSAEELETSKEELQSVNEELQTVNQELKIKIEELGLTNNDFQNLINSTDIATIFLDRQLRVKLSTPAAQKIFNLLPTDAGRKLSDITSRLEHGTLHEDMAQVLERLHTVEREVQASGGRTYLMRILPYRTTDNRIEGVSLTFHDVTEWRRAESRGRASEERLRLLIDRATDYAIFTISEDGRIDSWNAGAERMFGYSADAIIGSHVAVVFTPEDRAAGVPAAELETARAVGRAADERWHMRSDGTRLYCSGVTNRLGEGLGFAKIARDLTQQRQAELDLQQARAELEDRVVARTADMQAEVTRRARAQEKVMDLLRKLVTAQEDERARIARDLHDQFGQQLTALRLALEHHRQSHGAAYTDDDLDRALTLTREIDRQIDFLAWELRPATLDDLGLAVALPRYVKEWAAQYGVKADYQTTGTLHGRLTGEAETVFYRVAQEALTNVVKHAHATRVGVVLEARPEAVVLMVEDDGVGFDASGGDGTPTGIGLVGMFERASLIGARLQVESHPGGGTTVFLRCPASDVRGATT